ncbi:MAG TPA: DUF1080 domain-containing protein, partial [Candidatus Synoicihabitans sp.]|nr:DUF1080 domain-containing protein [Candidatus Synoicihabitans sp.]
MRFPDSPRTLASAFRFLALLGLGFAGFTWAGGAAREPAALFNGQNLEGWEVHLQGSAGPVAEQRVYQVRDGAIHVYRDAEADTEQPFAMLVTKEEYSDYRLSLEYRWGNKKFAPRAAAGVPMDAGLCYHVRGPIEIWPVSVECQIQFGDTGDVWAIKTQVTSTEHPDTRGFWDPQQGGVEVTRGDKLPLSYNRFVRRACMEQEGWNRVDVIVRGDEAEHFVNGQLVNRAMKMKYWDAAAGA